MQPTHEPRGEFVERLETHIVREVQRHNRTRAGRRWTQVFRANPWITGTVSASAVVFAVAAALVWRPADAPLFCIVEGDARLGDTIRSNGGGGVVLALDDGSRVEMRSNSELAVDSATDGLRIRLNSGGIIVNAAQQRTGHLYVQTKDVTVRVVGTVFLVNAEEQGSRVAVIEGEVRVQQGATEQKLRPGEQVATSPAMPSARITEEIAWSRNARRHLALLQQVAAAASVAPHAVRQAPGGQGGRTFDVVSVKRSAPQAGPVFGGGTFYKGNRWTGTNVTLRSLVRGAYDPTKYIAPDQIVGGPDWADSERFDLAGVASGTPTRSEFAEMVRAVLADRFQLRVHTEVRELPAIALMLAHADGRLGPALNAVDFDCAAYRAAFERREPPPGGVPQVGSVPRCSTLQSSGPSGMRLAGRAVEISQLARLLTQAFARPVVDRTALSGTYDFDLRYVTESGLQSVAPSSSPGDAPVLPTALAEQLGLNVESVRAPVEVLVIDHAERPSEN